MFDVSEQSSPLPGRAKLLAILIAVLALVAIGVSSYLAWNFWQTETIAGCSGDGLVDCDEVLGSRWASWLGMPVGLLGLLTYVGILTVCWPAAKRPLGLAGAMLLALSMLAAGSAVWFTAIQAVVLNHFCPYCMGVHICGVSIFGITLFLITGISREVDYDQMRTLLGVADPQWLAAQPSNVSHRQRSFYPWVAVATACLGLVLLIGGQLLVAPESLVEERHVAQEPLEAEEEKKEEAEDLTFDASTSGGSENDQPFGEEEKPESPVKTAVRRLEYEDLSKTMVLSEYPVIGNPAARHVFVEMMDYTCRHCRHLHPYILATLDRYGDQIAFVIYHVPLSSRCNPYVRREGPGKREACDYAKLAIGVWKLAPKEFPGFHDWLLESEKPPSIVEARRRAIRLAGEEVLLDDWVRADAGKRIGKQCDAFNRLKVGLPVMLTERGKVRGVPKDQQQWFAFLEERFEIEKRKEGRESFLEKDSRPL